MIRESSLDSVVPCLSIISPFFSHSTFGAGEPSTTVHSRVSLAFSPALRHRLTPTGWVLTRLLVRSRQFPRLTTSELLILGGTMYNNGKEERKRLKLNTLIIHSNTNCYFKPQMSTLIFLPIIISVSFIS